MKITWYEANTLMGEVVEFLQENGADLTSLKIPDVPGGGDAYEALAEVLVKHDGQRWNDRFSRWEDRDK